MPSVCWYCDKMWHFSEDCFFPCDCDEVALSGYGHCCPCLRWEWCCLRAVECPCCQQPVLGGNAHLTPSCSAEDKCLGACGIGAVASMYHTIALRVQREARQGDILRGAIASTAMMITNAMRAHLVIRPVVSIPKQHSLKFGERLY